MLLLRSVAAAVQHRPLLLLAPLLIPLSLMHPLDGLLLIGGAVTGGEGPTIASSAGSAAPMKTPTPPMRSSNKDTDTTDEEH